MTREVRERRQPGVRFTDQLFNTGWREKPNKCDQCDYAACSHAPNVRKHVRTFIAGKRIMYNAQYAMHWLAAKESGVEEIYGHSNRAGS